MLYFSAFSYAVEQNLSLGAYDAPPAPLVSWGGGHPQEDVFHSFNAEAGLSLTVLTPVPKIPQIEPCTGCNLLQSLGQLSLLSFTE